MYWTYSLARHAFIGYVILRWHLFGMFHKKSRFFQKHQYTHSENSLSATLCASTVCACLPRCVLYRCTISCWQVVSVSVLCLVVFLFLNFLFVAGQLVENHLEGIWSCLVLLTFSCWDWILHHLKVTAKKCLSLWPKCGLNVLSVQCWCHGSAFLHLLLPDSTED